jgi:hypothetical protein
MNMLAAVPTYNEALNIKADFFRKPEYISEMSEEIQSSEFVVFKGRKK